MRMCMCNRQMNVTTDQGQTFVNDQHTEMINNLRLEVEHNLDWVFTQGEVLDCGYDSPVNAYTQSGFSKLQLGGTSGVNPTNSTAATSVLAGPAYQSFQGLEPAAFTNGTQVNSPCYQLVNDPNEFGANSLGASFPVVMSGTTLVPTSVGGTAYQSAGYTTFYVTAPNGQVSEFVFYSTAGAGFTGAYLGPGFVSGTPTLFSAAATYNVQSILDVAGPNGVATPMFIQVAFNGAHVTSIGGFSLVATGTSGFALANFPSTGGRNPNFNAGFARRVSILQNTSSYSYTPAGTNSPLGQQTNAFGCHNVYYTAIIPLK